ncbi:lysosomal alpha-glucosidase-like [Topomyia yanbarensis]|uniref:lysosomal alpha-glucosidase-like n=1 Tax=Topomyia yanbarensis TaxID=2498891 RepID=UPI00273BEC2A|nr:lysosomal alpha-glucosidase-like [Topomyia yanbarensis]
MPPPLKQREIPDDEVQQEVDFPEFDKRPAFIHVLLLNKTLRLFFILGAAAVVIPAFAYLFFFSQEIGHEPKQQLVGTCGHPTLYHIQCGFVNISKEECHFLGCCYTSLATCYHSLPSEYQYQLEEEWYEGAILTPSRNFTPYRKSSTAKIQVHLSVLQKSRLQLTLNTVRQDNSRQQSGTQPISTIETDVLQAQIYAPTFFVEVKRKSNEEIIFSTARGPLVVTDDFIEWTLHLGVDILFGLGQAVLETGKKYMLLNNQNSSSVPVIMGYNSKTNQFNGIVFSTPGMTEIEIVRSRLIIIRSQFTGRFELELLPGPNPSDLHSQLKAISQNQYVPPFWSYGVHVCDHSRNVSLKNIQSSIETMLNTSIIFDSHCLNDDLFWLSSNMAITSQLEDALQLLSSHEKRFLPSIVMVLEPTGNSIHMNARRYGILLRSAHNIVPYRGQVRNRTAVYVDWRTNRPELTTWFQQAWDRVSNLNASGYSLKEDSLRDDGNTTYPNHSQLTYLPDGLNSSLMDLIRWDTKLSDSMDLVIRSQNRLGPEMVRIVQAELKGTDGLLITGAYDIYTKAAILAQNVSATWISLRNEVSHAIGLSVSGISFIGTPICGNAGDNVTEELCIRWYQFGSLLPLFKVTADRTPNQFSQFARRIMQSAIRKRYALLEYLNTLILTDSAYLRPMFYHYDEARNFTVELWEQFMVGNALLVAPVLLPQMAQIDIYFPETFYELWSGEELPTNDVLHYAVVESDLPLFLRPGCLVGLREIPDGILAVDEARLQQMYLIGALGCNARKSRCEAVGMLVFNTGFELSFTAVLEEKLVVRIQLKVSDVSLTESACSTTRRSLSGEVVYVQLYGHPNRTEPLVEVLNFDICKLESDEFEKIYIFTNADRE